MNLNKIILKNLQINEEYARKVLPFLKPDYFSDSAEKIIFNEISSFVTEYSNIPTFEALMIQLEEKPLAEGDYNSSVEILNEIHASESETVDLDWLVDKTESFCQEKAIYNAVLESITVLDGKHKELSKGAIPKLLSDALGVSFNSSVGHDYLSSIDDQFEYYHKVENKIPFDIDYLNKATNGGLPAKTLNIFVAGCVEKTTKVKIRVRKRG